MMKKITLPFLFAVLMSMVGTRAMAQSIVVANTDSKDICYNVTSDTEVSVAPGGDYSGNLVIPSNVIYSGKTYSVTGIDEKACYDCEELTSITFPNPTKGIYIHHGNKVVIK